MVPVYTFLLANGTETGCGTEVEFNHWNAMGVFGEGARLGDVICHEPAANDDKRKAQWAA
jgi:hypothetical protein